MNNNFKRFVNGIQIKGGFASDPAQGKVGEIYYNTTKKSLRLCIQISPVIWTDTGIGAGTTNYSILNWNSITSSWSENVNLLVNANNIFTPIGTDLFLSSGQDISIATDNGLNTGIINIGASLLTSISQAGVNGADFNIAAGDALTSDFDGGDVNIISGNGLGTGLNGKITLSGRLINIGAISDTDPANAIIADIYYNQIESRFKYYDGVSWIDIGSVGANLALSNLASVAINASLIAGADGTLDLGSSSFYWKDAYLGGILKFRSNTNKITTLVGSPSATASVNYILPVADGSAGQVLGTNASGVLSWINASSGAGLVHPTSGSTFEASQFNVAMTGQDNTCIGVNSGKLLTTGNTNVSLGNDSLKTATTAQSNVAIGRGAGYSLLSSSNNIFIGDSCAWQATTGAGNTIIGSIGGGSLTTGSSNTLVGGLSGYSLTTESDNIFIGTNAGFNQTLSKILVIDSQVRSNSADEISNSIIYGTMAATSADQLVRLNANVEIKHQLKLLGSTSGSVNFVAPAVVTGPSVYTLPSADGLAGQVLSTNASGVLSWVDAPLTISTVTLVNSQPPYGIAFTYPTATCRYAIIEYGISRNGVYRVGRLMVTHNGTDAFITDDYNESATIGITFNAIIYPWDLLNVNILYTSTNTGYDGIMKFSARKWA